MKTLRYLFACVLFLSIAVFVMPASAANPHIEEFEDPIQEFKWGYIVRPTGDENGYDVLYDYGSPYGSETLNETRDTTNLKTAIKKLEPGGTIKLVGGTYYISRVIICRKSINLIGAGMNHTTLVAKGAKKEDGSSVAFPLLTEKERDDNNFNFFRGPVVLRFAVPEDDDNIKVVCENLTIRTEGKAAKWYRGGSTSDGTIIEDPLEYESHRSVIQVWGNKQAGEVKPGPTPNIEIHDGIDHKINRIDAKFKNVRIQGTDSNRPFTGIYVISAEKTTLDTDLDPGGEGRHTGVYIAIEPANGIVEIEGCKFEKTKTYPVCVLGLATLTLPTIALDGSTVNWYYPDVDWAEPAKLTITGCDFIDAGHTPCPISAWLSNILIFDLNGADCVIKNNRFIGTKGMDVMILGGQSNQDPSMPFPNTARCDISDNYSEHIACADADCPWVMPGMVFADFGALLPEPLPPQKTIDIDFARNRISFNRPAGVAAYGIGLSGALFENNYFEGEGMSAIVLGVPNAEQGIDNNPAVNCTLLKNRVDNFNSEVLVEYPLDSGNYIIVDTPTIALGPGSNSCTVIGLNLGETVSNGGTNNELVDVQTATGGELGEAIRDAMDERIKITPLPGF